MAALNDTITLGEAKDDHCHHRPPLLLSRLRGHLLRKLVLVTPSLKDKKRAVDIVRNIETDISFYLVMVTAISIAIGFVMMATTAVLGIPDPLLWGTLAAVLSFAPYVGEFAIVILLSLAGIMTFDNLVQALVAPTIYFVMMTICWQGVCRLWSADK